MTQINDKDRTAEPPKKTTEKRPRNRTVNDLEPKDTSQVKGGRRITADPDEGGE